MKQQTCPSLHYANIDTICQKVWTKKSEFEMHKMNFLREEKVQYLKIATKVHRQSSNKKEHKYKKF